MAAQRDWLCQVCGLPAPENAVAVVDHDRWCLTSAPLHPDCAVLAQRHCPAVAAVGTLVPLPRGHQVCDGPYTPEQGFSQRWRIPDTTSDQHTANA